MSAKDSNQPHPPGPMTKIARALQERELLLSALKAADAVHAAWSTGMSTLGGKGEQVHAEYHRARLELEKFRAKNGL